MVSRTVVVSEWPFFVMATKAWAMTRAMALVYPPLRAIAREFIAESKFVMAMKLAKAIAFVVGQIIT